MPVAERLYYNDSFLHTFTARVSDIREYARTDGQSLWQIALDRTAFYPTSGGQPFDRGTLTAQARSGAALVAEIDEVIEDEDGEVWHSTRKPLLAGTEVTGSIDRARRLDHMQQHSGQHLLSAVFAEEFGARTLSFHLGEAFCTIDLAAEQGEAQNRLVAALEHVQQRVNERIAQDLPISLHTVSAEEAQALLASGKVRKLPPRSGPIRLVEIPGLDLNACGGTHVRSLGQIGSLLLRSTEQTKKALRVEFLCGLRAATAARQDFVTLASTAASLSVARESVPTATARLLAENKALAKASQRLREELVQHHALQLISEEPLDRRLRLVERSFPDRDAEYVKLLASRLVAAAPQTATILISSSVEPATLVVACSKGLTCGCGERLRAVLAARGLRGGGSPDMAQATLPYSQALEVAAQLRADLLVSLRAPIEAS